MSQASHAISAPVDNKSRTPCISLDPRPCEALSHSPFQQFSETRLHNQGRDQITRAL
jgi:hypothetical protein